MDNLEKKLSNFIFISSERGHSVPEISVLMSVYNSEQYIKDSIDSILEQTFPDFELIIINDGSTDKTREIIEGYKDGRIRIFNFKENKGVGAALKFGLTQVNGRYIAKADSDDINHPERLFKQKIFLDNHPDIALVKTLLEYFPHNEVVANSQRFNYIKTIMEKQKNEIVTPEDIQEKLYWYCCIPHTTIMGRTDAICAIGYEEMRIWEDYKLFYEMNKNGFKMATISEVLVRMRVSESSVTATTENQEFVNVMYDIKQEEINNLFTNQSKVYIWGSGSMGQNLSNVLRKHDLDFVGFVDSDEKKWGQAIEGKTVFPPNILERNGMNNKILVASQPGKIAIVDCLKKMGYKHLQDYVVLF